MTLKQNTIQVVSKTICQHVERKIHRNNITLVITTRKSKPEKNKMDFLNFKKFDFFHRKSER